MEVMKPLSRRRRMIQFTLSVLVFLVVGPALILFATGYSFPDFLSVVRGNFLKTGGIYVSEIGSNSTVILDGKKEETSSFLNRNILFQRLSLEPHTITIKKPDYRPWEKDVVVYANRVTEIRPLLLKEEIEVLEITEQSFLDLLKNKLAEKQKVAEENEKTENKNYDITLESGDLVFSWKVLEDSPQYLCSLDRCESATTVMVPGDIVDFEWYPNRNDALVVLTGKAIFAVELDSRNGRVSTEILKLSEVKMSSLGNKKTKTSLLVNNGLTYLHYAGKFFLLDF